MSTFVKSYIYDSYINMQSQCFGKQGTILLGQHTIGRLNLINRDSYWMNLYARLNFYTNQHSGQTDKTGHARVAYFLSL